MDYTEAFKALDALNEDTFSVSEKGIEDLKDFLDDDNQDLSVLVIDPEAESEDELHDSYIGKVILCCNVCKSNIFKDKEDVIIDDTLDVANSEEECPYCHTVDGFTIIGEVAPFSETEVEADVEDDVEVKVDGEEVEVKEKEDEEELTESKKSLDDIDAIRDDKVEKAKRRFQRVRDDADSRRDYEKKHDLEECEDKDLKEDFSEVEVTTAGDEKQTIKVSSKEVEDEETIKPVSDEVIAEIEDNSEESADEEELELDVDEVVEESLNNLCSKYLKENYNNVKSFKLTDASSSNNKLKLEGIISFTSGNSKKTSFIFESREATKTGKIRFVGENLQICKGSKAFSLRGKLNGNKFLAESMSYNYRTKDSSGKSVIIRGTVSNK